MGFLHERWTRLVMASSSAWILLSTPGSVQPQSVKTHEDARQVLVLEKVVVKNGTVSGEVINRSPRLVRAVQLFIRYTWLWDAETKPGKQDPSSSFYYTLREEIKPGARIPFMFEPSSPLARNGGGRYETSVSVAGFTEVIPQGS